MDNDTFKKEMSAVRARIAEAKRRGTRRGFIDYYGCLRVCNELIAILDEAKIASQRGDYVFAYSVASLVLVNAAKLAGTADDSAGGVSDAKRSAKNVLDQACIAAAGDAKASEYIYQRALQDSQRKEFEGWDDFAYDLLMPAARLATAENVHELYAVLNALTGKISEKKYASWHLESDRLVRLAAITAVESEQAAEAFIAQNITFDAICLIAIQKALEKQNFLEAEKLCREKIRSINRGYHWQDKWYNLLFDIYLQSNNRKMQKELAHELLVNKCDSHYYNVLKTLLLEDDAWDSAYPSLLKDLSQRLMYNSYMQILSEENETKLLLEEIRKHPSQVFTYLKLLAKHYPAEVYAICGLEIEKLAMEANNRPLYRKICAHIRELHNAGGVVEAKHIIENLIPQYKRRPAMVEELEKLERSFLKKEHKAKKC